MAVTVGSGGCVAVGGGWVGVSVGAGEAVGETVMVGVAVEALIAGRLQADRMRASVRRRGNVCFMAFLYGIGF
jgi:hypothetical protein